MMCLTVGLWGLWQLLACIGEQFAEGDEVCGIVVNMRAKQDKLCLWSKTAANEASQVPHSIYIQSQGPAPIIAEREREREREGGGEYTNVPSELGCQSCCGAEAFTQGFGGSGNTKDGMSVVERGS
jgi:hypothetical protein